MSLNVWQFDPAQLTPYYNLSLCKALAEAGCRVRYITSRSIYDDMLIFPDTFTTDFLYFRRLNGCFFLRYSRLRRLLRAASYPLGHWQVLRQIRRSPPDIFHTQWSRLPVLDLRLIRHIQRLSVATVTRCPDSTNPRTWK